MLNTRISIYVVVILGGFIVASVLNNTEKTHPSCTMLPPAAQYENLRHVVINRQLCNFVCGDELPVIQRALI